MYRTADLLIFACQQHVEVERHAREIAQEATRNRRTVNSRSFHAEVGARIAHDAIVGAYVGQARAKVDRRLRYHRAYLNRRHKLLVQRGGKLLEFTIGSTSYC